MFAFWLSWQSSSRMPALSIRSTDWERGVSKWICTCIWSGGRACRIMGLDYGELDVLRDTEDGKLYVADVNNTPWDPPTISMSKVFQWHYKDSLRRSRIFSCHQIIQLHVP